MKKSKQQNQTKAFARVMDFVNRCENDLLCRIPMLVCVTSLLLMTITTNGWHTWCIYIGIISVTIWVAAMLINLIKGRRSHDEDQKKAAWRPMMDVVEKMLFCI